MLIALNSWHIHGETIAKGLQGTDCTIVSVKTLS